MSKKSKTLLITLGILILLGGGYFGSIIWTKNKAGLPARDYPSPIQLGNPDYSELVKIEGDGIIIEKIGEIWELTSLEGKIPPAGIKINQNSIEYITYALGMVMADDIASEAPKDISEYGFDNPLAVTIVTDSSGWRTEYILGNKSPSGSAYYLMQEGDPRVYMISGYIGNYFHVSLDSIRERSLFPAFEFQFQDITLLRIESEGTFIEAIPKESYSNPLFIAPYSTHVIISPGKVPRGSSTEALDKFLSSFQNLRIAEFIDENPSSLSDYGLDKPVRVLLETTKGNVDLLVGSAVNGMRYAKLNESPLVFTLNDMESIIDLKYFSLIDKLINIINIDLVENLYIIGGEKTLTAKMEGGGENSVFYLNGRKAEDRSFRNFYQAVISLMADTEYPGPSDANAGNEAITIEYRFKENGRQNISIKLIPYNRDLYSLLQEGKTEYLVSRNQVRKIYEAAEAVIYE